MKVTIKYLAEFKRRAKVLEKKYNSFKEDYNTFLDELERNPFGGESLGHHTYKYRMTISSKGKGKSGGARVITYNVKKVTDYEVVITLMTIYDKNEISNVSDAYLRSLIHLLEHK
ncbi:MAG: addiction module toxin RelE [Prevotella sp.]|nr:addiction module toxin RelE [Prevotella sp.]